MDVGEIITQHGVSLLAIVLALAGPYIREHFGKGFASIAVVNDTAKRIDAKIKVSDERTADRFDGVFARVAVTEDSLHRFDENVSALRDRVLRLEEHDKYIAERIVESIVKPMERVSSQMERQAEQLSNVTVAVKVVVEQAGALERRLDRAEKEWRRSHPTNRSGG